MEEFKKEENINVKTEEETSVETKTPDVLPRYEDLVKSEQVEKKETHIEGVSQIKEEYQPLDRIFTRKSDEKKEFFKKRIKIVTAVYTVIVALLVVFIIGNVATLAILNKDIKSNIETIQSERTELYIKENLPETGENVGEIQIISLNEPRDYSEDEKELTFLDKISILFRNIFS